MYNMSPKLSHEHTLDHTRKRRTIFLWTVASELRNYRILTILIQSRGSAKKVKVEAEQLPPDMAKPSEAVDPHEEHSVGRLRCQVVLMDEMGMECFMCMIMYACFCVLGQFWMDFHQLILMRKFGNQVDIPLRLCKLPNCTYSAFAPRKIGCLDRGKAHFTRLVLETGRTIRGARELAIGVTSHMKHLDLD